VPINKEFTIKLEDRPGTLGKFCRTLAERAVNLLAFQSFRSTEGQSSVHLVADNPATLRTVLQSERTAFTESDIAQVRLPHRPGELGRAATRLGDAGININYAYVGVDPGSSSPLLVFGVADVARAAKILDEVASAAA
jgi:hypothetical protein